LTVPLVFVAIAASNIVTVPNVVPVDGSDDVAGSNSRSGGWRTNVNVRSVLLLRVRTPSGKIWIRWPADDLR
jgi:hypothetical protein